MNAQIFEQARRYAEHRLEQELSSNLLYHGIAHTREEVVPAAKTFADMEGIQGEPLYLLITAAWFHDLGHVEKSIDHEAIGVQIAEEVLPSFGYTHDQMGIVRGCILATVLPQSPTNILEQILADADLDVLGRENFMQRNADLRSELAFLGKEFSNEQWYSEQLKFLEGHKYFTAAARSLRDTRKEININELRQTVELLK